jgi:hypothetical protein
MIFWIFLRGRIKSWSRRKQPAARLCVASALLSLLSGSTPSSAVAGTVTSGESDAYGLTAAVTVTIPYIGSTTFSLPPQPTVGGTAPAPYSYSNSQASLSAGVFPIATLDTGKLNVAASSDVDGLPGSRTATASSSVKGLSASIGVLGSVLSISSGNDVLTETSTVSGTYGSLQASGALTLTGRSDLVVYVFGTKVLTITPGEVINPNTTIDLSGMGTLTINEQILDPGTNGTTFAGITSNFLDLSLTRSFGGLSVTDDLTVDHTHASLTAGSVPEPSSLVLASLGAFALVGYGWRRRSA